MRFLFLSCKWCIHGSKLDNLILTNDANSEQMKHLLLISRGANKLRTQVSVNILFDLLKYSQGPDPSSDS